MTVTRNQSRDQGLATMATKNQVAGPQQQKKVELLPRGERKNATPVPDGNNRRALWNILFFIPLQLLKCCIFWCKLMLCNHLGRSFGAQATAVPDKAACEITGKPKGTIPDIDASDVGDQLAVVDYVEDLYKYYKHAENACMPCHYMDTQVEINEKMRAVLGDWLVEAHFKFELMPETLYLTFYIIDKYLSMEKVTRKELQLVGISSMLIASKYEDIWPPQVEDFITISDGAYNQEQILGMEKLILNKLKWTLSVPTSYVFLVRFIKAAMSDKQLEHMTYFFAELGLLQYKMIMNHPSMLAASAVYSARCTLNRTPLWTETLRRHTGFSEPELKDCAKMLVSSHIAAAPEGKLNAIYKKYSRSELCAVALHPPAMKVVEESEESKA